MRQLSYVLGRSRANAAPRKKKDRLPPRQVLKILRGLPRASFHRGAHTLSTLGRWVAKRLRQRRRYKQLKARRDLQLLLHAQAMKQLFDEAEEKARAEIALRIQAEHKARREAEARLEIERVARREAERKLGWASGRVRLAHPETIAKAQREMMSRVKTEQLAIRKISGR